MPGRQAGVPPTAYRRAIQRLARRDHTRAELRRALLLRGHKADEVDEAIARLVREKYLDDSGYAARFATSRLAHHGLGRTRIRQALRQRGVGRREVEAGLHSALAEVDEGAVVDSLARRYWKAHARVEPERRLPRLWAFLLRRGFAPGLVKERLAELWPRWSDALEGLEPLEGEER
ncbi:MAG TPA: regulatory protein RecX [Vicinamibacteria bacterium]|nr:regulatory protein RecX [Vicinamibacteria bacterium]